MFNKKVTTEIVDYSKIPTDEEIRKFNDMLKSIDNYNMKPFWNIETGELYLGVIGDAKGILLMSPSIYIDNIKAMKKFPNKNKYFINKIIMDAQLNRLQYLYDIEDMPDQVDYYKISKQLVNGVILADEINNAVLIKSLNLLIENNDYELLINTVSVLKTELLYEISSELIELNSDFLLYSMKDLFKYKNMTNILFLRKYVVNIKKTKK